MEFEYLQPVCVTWADAHDVVLQWSDQLDDENDRIVYTSGFLLENAKLGHIVLIQSVDSVGNIDNGLAIPDAMVIEVRNLGKPVRPSKDYPFWHTN